MPFANFWWGWIGCWGYLRALLAQQMLGTDAFSGLPAALLTLGSAGAAFIVGRLSQRFGRRLGLTVGFMTGGIGAIGVVIATATKTIDREISKVISLFFISIIYFL